MPTNEVKDQDITLLIATHFGFPGISNLETLKVSSENRSNKKFTYIFLQGIR